MLRRLAPPRQVEVLPGRHLVANVDGIVIVVADRDTTPSSPKSRAAQDLSTLITIVRRTDPRRLARAVKRFTMRDRAPADFSIVTTSPAGFDVYLYGAVTVTLDDGPRRTLLRGARAALRLHGSVPIPAVAVAVTVDEAGERPPVRSPRPGVSALGAGTVPGQGAVIWSGGARPSTPSTVQIGVVCGHTRSSGPRSPMDHDPTVRTSVVPVGPQNTIV